jgi:hypothetical protein
MSDFGAILIAIVLSVVAFALLSIDTRLEHIEHLIQQETHRGG